MVNTQTLDAKEAKAVASTLANPAPLGLMGFGMTTVLLNLLNAGLITSSAWSMILAMGIFYGGVAQIIAGIMEFGKGNTFGTTAFTSYGLFWISLVTLLIFPKLGWYPAPDGASMAAYLALWGVFTAYMFVGTLNKNKAIQLVFGSLAVLFFLLAIGDFTGIALIKIFAGLEGIVCGFSAIYLAAAEVLNDAHGRQVLPIGGV
ncbi:MAG TPA: acetate uptake transporter [Methanocella sp.]|uniref:acetate uptake transporter n=1 Tax=Methanocella sp. TaxID=2052833 RepID=UPI002BCF4A6C|nr:acetate uptake transporter [Methanocella sp.]HTY91584.1 acetate uptake transporter [Methanocella sp.]